MNNSSIALNTPRRAVLEGVPRIQFYEGGPRCPEDLTIPSVMRALMEYIGEEDFGCRTSRTLQPGCKINCSYSFFVGVTGEAAYLSWKEGWHGDNVAAFYMSDDPAAPERWAYRAAGYGYSDVEKQEGRDNEALFRQRIIESIQRNRPVTGYGIIGPPEPAIITGYDDYGDVLIGWSFFQGIPKFNNEIEFEPSGYFRKRDWFKDIYNLFIIEDKQEKPLLKDVYRDALTWMLKVARTPMVITGSDVPEWYKDRHNGLAAYEAWASHLLRDEDFPFGDEAVLHQRHEVHEGAVGMVAERRWYGSQFLVQASNPDILHYKMAEDLLHAAACYAAEHDLMWKLWDLAGGNGNPEAYRKLADPGIRRQMIPIILQARDKDAEAADHIERALAK